MKIQCNACEAAEAEVLCCADEAALCRPCDEKVHAANKLASKHQRVPLSISSSKMPKCDICQETAGFFFCLEDRALLCRRCDVSVHTANSLVSAHQRFLLTGVKVGLEGKGNGPEHVASSVSSDKTRSHSGEKSPGSNPPQDPKRVRTFDQSSKSQPVQASKMPLAFTGGSSSDGLSQWQLDEFLELGDYGQNCDFIGQGSSKADCGKLGDPDWSPLMRAADMEVEGEDCMGQSPNAFWTVPEIPSPPTSSGLHWSKIPCNSCDSAAFVPDITSLLPNSKRRKHF